MSDDGQCKCAGTHGACTTEFQYAVKLLCGDIAPSSTTKPHTHPLAPGHYWTAINIHNPHKCSQAIFRWKVAIADKSGYVSNFQPTQGLNPDGAFEIDCSDVMTIDLPSSLGKFLKGYVVIESDMELDVVAVYTTAQPNSGVVNTLHTERVAPRCVPVCEDLVLPMHTGFANWRTIGGSNPVAAVLVNPLATPWSLPPFGSYWISQHTSDGQNAQFGIFSYELCFTLCSGFMPPTQFPIQVLADGMAEVSLNSLLPNVGIATSSSTPTTLSVNPSFLQVGPNCFRVKVTNIDTTLKSTGFALAGLLHVGRGKCPCVPLPIIPGPPL